MLKFKISKEIVEVNLDSRTVEELTIPYREDLTIHHTPVMSKNDFGILNEALYPYELEDIKGFKIKIPKNYERNPLRSRNGLWKAKPLTKDEPTHKLIIVHGEFRITGATSRKWTLVNVNNIDIPYIDEFGLFDQIPPIPDVWLHTYQVRNWRRYYVFFVKVGKTHSITLDYHRRTGRGNTYENKCLITVTEDQVVANDGNVAVLDSDLGDIEINNITDTEEDENEEN